MAGDLEALLTELQGQEAGTIKRASGRRRAYSTKRLPNCTADCRSSCPRIFRRATATNETRKSSRSLRADSV